MFSTFLTVKIGHEIFYRLKDELITHFQQIENMLID